MVTIQEVDPDETDLEIWKNKVKGYVSSNTQLDQNIQKVYNILLWKCTYNLKSQLEASPDFRLVKREDDLLGLIGIIKVLVFKYEDQKNLADALYMGLKAFYDYYQKKNVREDE